MCVATYCLFLLLLSCCCCLAASLCSILAFAMFVPTNFFEGGNGEKGLDRMSMSNVAAKHRRLLWVHWASVYLFTAITFKFLWDGTLPLVVCVGVCVWCVQCVSVCECVVCVEFGCVWCVSVCVVCVVGVVCFVHVVSWGGGLYPSTLSSFQ
jgi:hypothetical protein